MGNKGKMLEVAEDIAEDAAVIPWEDCFNKKQQRVSKSELLSLVHSDICGHGRLNHKTVIWHSLVLLLRRCVFSWRKWVRISELGHPDCERIGHLIPLEDQVSEYFRLWYAVWEHKTGKKLKCLYGGEYTSREFDNCYGRQNIQHGKLVWHTI